MLKKQTVWLLTMLSLMVVLSVYYMTSPDKEDLAYIDNNPKESKTTTGTGKELSKEEKIEETEVSDIANISQDELFTTIRMELQDERSMKKDRLNDVVASSSATTEEKNKALDGIDELEQATSKETILQDSILAEVKDYEDVLVRSDDKKVFVHVKVNELSRKEVVNIIQKCRDEFGEKKVFVNFQPVEG